MTLTIPRACWSRDTICTKETMRTRDTLAIPQPLGSSVTLDGRDPLLLMATKKRITTNMSSIERERVKKQGITWPTLDWKGILWVLLCSFAYTFLFYNLIYNINIPFCHNVAVHPCLTSFFVQIWGNRVSHLPCSVDRITVILESQIQE